MRQNPVNTNEHRPYPWATSLALLAALLSWPVITVLYGKAISGQYAFIREWEWSNLLWLSIVLPLLLFQENVGLPNWYGKNINWKTKWLLPLLIGLFFAILDVVVMKLVLHPGRYESLPPFLQPFPYSLFLYPSGALEIELYYRLLPITAAAFIGTKWLSRENSQKLLWIVVVLCSLREPVEQWPHGPAWMVIYSLVTGFAMNLIQALAMVRYGFSSALATRLGHYLLWHIGLGIFVQFVEKAAM